MGGEAACLPYPYYHFLWGASWMSFVAAVYGYATGKPADVYIAPGAIFFTSILYWFYPVHYSWQYYLDISTVHIMALYSLFRAYNAEFMYAYYAFFCAGVGFFPIGLYYYNRGMYVESTFAHMMLHLVANIGNIVVFSGKYEEICSPKSFMPSMICSAANNLKTPVYSG